MKKSQVGRRRRGAAALLAALLVAVGCGGEEREGAEVAGAERPSAQAEKPRAAAGTATIEVVDGLVTLHSNGAQRRAILEQLAREMGFALEIRELEERALTFHTERVALAEVLDMLLEGAPYAAGFDADAARGEHVLAWLRVGGPLGAAAGPGGLRGGGKEPRGRRMSAALRARAERRASLRERLDEPRRDPEELRRRFEEERAEQERRDADWAGRLEDADPAVRRRAVGEVSVQGKNIERMASFAVKDPDSQVRLEAVNRLAETSSFGAVKGMIAALADSDPEVVIAALRGLEWTADASVLGAVEALRDHPDPQVRETAAEVAETLSW